MGLGMQESKQKATKVISIVTNSQKSTRVHPCNGKKKVEWYNAKVSSFQILRSQQPFRTNHSYLEQIVWGQLSHSFR